MCPQLAYCLLNTDLGPTVIHTFQPPMSKTVSTLLCVTLLFLCTGFYFYSSAFINSCFHSYLSPSLPLPLFLSRPPGHLAAPEIWYWNALFLYVSKRYRKGRTFEKDMEETEGQIAKADKRWARPKAHGAAAVISNLQTSKAAASPGYHLNVTQNGSIWLQQKSKQNTCSIKVLNHFFCVEKHSSLM